MKDASKVTIRDVAEQAGVSISSVSRYLNDENSVKPVAAYKIREAINQLQYVPDVFARNLRTRKSNVIGLVLPHTRNFWGDICNILTNLLFDKGYMCYVCVTDNDGVKEKRFVHELITMHAAGIIIIPSGQNTQYLRSVNETYQRMLLFDSTEFECDALLPLRYRECSARLAEHMLRLYPDEKTFCIFGFQKNDSIRAMEKGLDGAVEKLGYAAEKCLKYFNCRASINIERAAKDILAEVKSGGKPVIICYGAIFTESLLMLLLAQDKAILDKIHLAGFTEHQSFQRIGYDYPCIFRNDQECGVLLAQQILRKIENGGDGTEPPEILYACSTEHLLDD